MPEHRNLPLDELAKIKSRQGVELVSSGELRVVDEDGNEVPRDAETLGEITVRGNVVMKGYYNDPDATNAAIKDGWFHSGDAAVVHPDGYVEIRDRFKDVIISGGENISSVEVEGCLLRHPAVQEVAVVGMPHEKWGESPHAFRDPAPGQGSHRGRAKAARARQSRPFQDTAVGQLRGGTAEDRHRQGAKVRPAWRQGGHHAAVAISTETDLDQSPTCSDAAEFGP